MSLIVVNSYGKLKTTSNFLYASLLGLAASIRYFIIYFKSKKSEITVTNTYIIGVTASGNRIDLPLDLVTRSFLSNNGTLTITTADSASVMFSKIENSSQIFDEIKKRFDEYNAAAAQEVEQQPVQS